MKNTKLKNQKKKNIYRHLKSKDKNKKMLRRKKN